MEKIIVVVAVVVVVMCPSDTINKEKKIGCEKDQAEAAAHHQTTPDPQQADELWEAILL